MSACPCHVVATLMSDEEFADVLVEELVATVEEENVDVDIGNVTLLGFAWMSSKVKSTDPALSKTMHKVTKLLSPRISPYRQLKNEMIDPATVLYGHMYRPARRSQD